jgi:hypothetical protein
MSDKRPPCFDRFPPSLLAASGNAAKAVRRVHTRWPQRSELRVRFLGGTKEQHERARAAAEEWMKHCNILFTFGEDPHAPVRIAFDPGEGNWSFIGQECLEIPVHEPTMNLENWDDAGTLLHEFGHCLCLEHEHAHPEGGIRWKKRAVYEALGGAPNYWTPAQVEAQVFKRYDGSMTVRNAFDVHSIMMYEFPAAWTEDGFSTTRNTKLSAGDIAFIGSEKGGYPPDPA